MATHGEHQENDAEEEADLSSEGGDVAGESTCSANSSITSYTNRSRDQIVTPSSLLARRDNADGSERVPDAATPPMGGRQHHQPHVRFSSMNPNPQLVLLDDPPIRLSSSQSQTSLYHNQQQQQQTQPTSSSSLPGNLRAISWEDDYIGTTSPTVSWVDGADLERAMPSTRGGSRGSRSGLSSPTIEPPLSPLSERSKKRTSLQFGDVRTIDTITEAAMRLRMETNTNANGTASQNQDNTESHPPREEEGPQNMPLRSPRVHFSAMRLTVPTLSNSFNGAAAEAQDGTRQQHVLGQNGMLNLTDHNGLGLYPPTSPIQDNTTQTDTLSSENQVHNQVVHFADENDVNVPQSSNTSRSCSIPLDPLEPPHPLSSDDMHDMSLVADRLRRLIRRAEAGGSSHRHAVSLEAAFAHFDSSASGYITSLDLREGLQRLGESFHFTAEECDALLLHLADNKPNVETRGISLLEFYRAMGRKSPPPSPLPSEDEAERWAEDEDGGDAAAADEEVARTWPEGPPRSRNSSLELSSCPVVHAEDAAVRLRAMVDHEIAYGGYSSAVDPIESFFRTFDTEHSGYITAEVFRQGLRTMSAEPNGPFAIMNDDDCGELVAMLSSKGRVSLIDFYRFMGRRSPPPLQRGGSPPISNSELSLLTSTVPVSNHAPGHVTFQSLDMMLDNSENESDTER